jgi:hypothetical protein
MPVQARSEHIDSGFWQEYVKTAAAEPADGWIILCDTKSKTNEHSNTQ